VIVKLPKIRLRGKKEVKNMFKWFKICGAIIILLSMLVACAPPTVEEPEIFYKGKTVEFLVPYKPGGGYDLYARALAPYLEKLTGATIVVKNLPGAAGLLAVNNLYTAAPDGLTIAIANLDTAITGELFKDEACQFETLKFTWLARLTDEVYFLSMSAKSPYKTIADVLGTKVPIKIGAVSKSDATGTAASAFIEALGLNAKMVIGYGGTKDVEMACIKGEVDAMSCSASSTVRYAKTGETIPVVVLAEERTKDLPNVPTIFEAVKLSKEAKWVVEKRIAIGGVTRSVLAPPNLSKDKAKFLEEAISKTLSDPTFIEAAKKQELFINYLPGEKARKLAEEVLGMSVEDKGKLQKILAEKYY